MSGTTRTSCIYSWITDRWWRPAQRRCPEYRYTLNVVVVDFSGDQGLLMAPVLARLMENQPDAIHNPELREKLFTFEVDILRNDICDISLNLQLTERVIVSADGDVSSVEAVPEPDEPGEMWAVRRG